VQRLILDMAAVLHVSCAHADFALVGNQLRKQQLARRYLALDISDISSTAIDMTDRASGAYWLNIYGTEMTKTQGTVAGLRLAMRDSRIVGLDDSKIALFLSDMPRRGDRNNREELPEHVALARFLSNSGVFHVPSRVVYFEDENDVEGADLQRMWHR